ncbi:MAG: aminomethyltransferase beta-barrel domain-containing protein [Merdibacter sp.]
MAVQRCLHVSGVQWFPDHRPQNELSCTAKFRYRQQDHAVTLRFLDETTAYVAYPQRVSAVTCGQEAVFYQGEECLGGGVIEHVFAGGEDISEKIRRQAALHWEKRKGAKPWKNS